MALRELLGHAPWPTWEPALRDRDPQRWPSVARRRTRTRSRSCGSSSGCSREQWRELREYAAARGVLLFGDLPIFVSLDSADVWAHRELFQLDGRGGRPR